MYWRAMSNTYFSGCIMGSEWLKIAAIFVCVDANLGFLPVDVCLMINWCSVVKICRLKALNGSSCVAQ